MTQNFNDREMRLIVSAAGAAIEILRLDLPVTGAADVDYEKYMLTFYVTTRQSLDLLGLESEADIFITCFAASCVFNIVICGFGNINDENFLDAVCGFIQSSWHN